MADIDNNLINNLRKLGETKNSEDEGGGDNALMELITNAFNRALSMAGKGGLPGATLINGLPSTGVQVGLEAKDGFTAKQIRPSQNLSGGEGALYKIFAALKKGGMSIRNLCEGIEPQQPIDMSWAQLGTLSAPITPNTGGAGVGMDLA